MSDTTVWGIHAGRTGDADKLFLDTNVIAVGWHQIGDLAKLSATRDAFKEAVVAAYPHKKPGAIPNNAGQLFRFVYEMKVGDIVCYPCKADRSIHIGRITGPYFFRSDLEPGYPNRRPVKWQKTVSRTNFTQGALHEIGSAMSLFQIRNYADEFLAALEGKAAVSPVESDESVALVAQEIEETTRDFIIKTLSQELKGKPFEYFVAHLLNTMGYRTRVAPVGTDGGIDIVAHKDELGFEPPIVKVQVKSGDGSVGIQDVTALYGHVESAEYGLVVSLGSFSKQAETFAKSKSNLRLIDSEALVDLVLAHYEQFDSKYKGVLPLQRVYVPEPIPDDEVDE